MKRFIMSMVAFLVLFAGFAWGQQSRDPFGVRQLQDPFGRQQPDDPFGPDEFPPSRAPLAPDQPTKPAGPFPDEEPENTTSITLNQLATKQAEIDRRLERIEALLEKMASDEQKPQQTSIRTKEDSLLRMTQAIHEARNQVLEAQTHLGSADDPAVKEALQPVHEALKQAAAAMVEAEKKLSQ